MRKTFATLEELDKFEVRLGLAMPDLLYDPTKFSIATGDDAVLDDIFSYQIYNKIKNHWVAATEPSDKQVGMIWQDSDDDIFRGRTSTPAWLELVTDPLQTELDCGAHSVGFTQQTATGDGTTTIDFKLGNKFFFTYGAMNETFTFTAPTKPCNLILVLKQDGVGGRTPTWPASVKFPNGTEPTWSSGANEIDIAALYYDGTDYYLIGSLNFS